MLNTFPPLPDFLDWQIVSLTLDTRMKGYLKGTTPPTEKYAIFLIRAETQPPHAPLNELLVIMPSVVKW